MKRERKIKKERKEKMKWERRKRKRKRWLKNENKRLITHSWAFPHIGCRVHGLVGGFKHLNPLGKLVTESWTSPQTWCQSHSVVGRARQLDSSREVSSLIFLKVHKVCYNNPSQPIQWGYSFTSNKLPNTFPRLLTHLHSVSYLRQNVQPKWEWERKSVR